MHDRVVKGEDFSELAKRYSEGSTARKAADLGTFERGQLSAQLEEAVFKLDKGQVTDVIQTKTGFEILKVLDHYAGRPAAARQSRKRNHEQALHEENGARPAQLSSPSCARKAT